MKPNREPEVDKRNNSRFEAEHRRILAAYRAMETAEKVDFFTYSDEAHVIRLHERYWMTLRILKKHGYHPLTELRILDVGCGDGRMLRQFLQWGAKPEQLAGIELRTESVEVARYLSPHIDVRQGSAISLPWPGDSFDLVCLHTVFSSILDEGMRYQIATEVCRVLRPGGAILWYDFIYNNPRNPHVRGLSAKTIRALFRSLEIYLYRITLAPFIARRIPCRVLLVVYPLLSAIPMLRTHYLGILVKRDSIGVHSHSTESK